MGKSIVAIKMFLCTKKLKFTCDVCRAHNFIMGGDASGPKTASLTPLFYTLLSRTNMLTNSDNEECFRNQAMPEMFFNVPGTGLFSP